MAVRAGSQWFAIPARLDRFVGPMPAISCIPKASPALLGLINLRGAIVAVVCLKRRLDAGAAAGSPAFPSVMIACEDAMFALGVDEVGDVLAPGDREILATSPHLEPALAAYLNGVMRTPETLLPILDLERLLDFRAAPLAA